MQVTTRYTTTASGAGRIVAKAQGKQKTVPYDQTRSPEANHGIAAASLILAGFSGIASAVVRDLDAGKVIHGGGNGGHLFRWED